MNLRFYTGASGPDVALAASAHAAYSAQNGIRTLLVSLGPAHYLALPAVPAAEPINHSPNLDVLAFDATSALTALHAEHRAMIPQQLATITPDELPLLPGFETALGLRALGLLRDKYEQIVIDAGSHDSLIRGLALADSLRWGIRLLFGLDRDPGRSSASVGRAMLPTALLPLNMVEGAQELRVATGAARDQLVDTRHTIASFVLPDSAITIPEARLGIAALQLYGLQVAHVLVGPFHGNSSSVLESAREIWASRTVLAFPEQHDHTLAELGAQIEGKQAINLPAPIAFEHNGHPAIVLELPGLPTGTLKLTLSGDELIVRIGPYRRHMLVPDSLRGIASIKATREGESLIIQRR